MRRFNRVFVGLLVCCVLVSIPACQEIAPKPIKQVCGRVKMVKTEVFRQTVGGEFDRYMYETAVVFCDGRRIYFRGDIPEDPIPTDCDVRIRYCGAKLVEVERLFEPFKGAKEE